jgi:hypothetical protein
MRKRCLKQMFREGAPSHYRYETILCSPSSTKVRSFLSILNFPVSLATMWWSRRRKAVQREPFYGSSRQSAGRLFFIHSTGSIKTFPCRSTSESGGGLYGCGRIFEDCLMVTPELLTLRHLTVGNHTVLYCAHRASTFRSCALCEQEGQLVAHLLSFIARSTSRLASRVLMVSRRSCSFLPLANPSSTLAKPRLEK